jgi:23S rRNA (cytosine1962-C5)-methyltransferase
MDEAVVVINKRGAERVRRGHPWIFRSDVEKEKSVPPGAIVRVVGPGRRQLGHALYSSRSEIRLRMLGTEQTLSPTFLEERLAAAIAWRRRAQLDAGACRLVHGEGDRLPSLIVDRYADVIVVQTLAQGMDRLKDEIVRCLVAQVKPRGILERNDPRSRALEGLEQQVGVLHGDVPESVEVADDGVRMRVDPWKGQKTGLFLDQRENQVAARRFARGRVLDAFAYDGGFGLHAAATAQSVLSVDSSASAIERIRANAALSGFANVEAREANVFDLLREMNERGERFDLVVLDPPAFAKNRGAVEKARSGYKEINRRALMLLPVGGVLFTCSCSYHVSEPDFEAILASAAADAGVSVAILEKRRQASDHPVLLGVPETSYLKAFVLRRVA